VKYYSESLGPYLAFHKKLGERMIEDFLSRKLIIMPLWAAAVLVFVLTWLVCRYTKPTTPKSADFLAALIAAITVIVIDYFLH
jgi:hypothetical protein